MKLFILLFVCKYFQEPFYFAICMRVFSIKGAQLILYFQLVTATQKCAKNSERYL